jgi:hypothetical protein
LPELGIASPVRFKERNAKPMQKCAAASCGLILSSSSICLKPSV